MIANPQRFTGGRTLIASFHIVEYRKRVFSPPKRLAGQIAGLRFWRPFNIGGDFAYFRAHPSRWALYPRLKPDFRHWAFYAVWEEDAALEEFLTISDTGQSWRGATTEACHFWLRPTHARGQWSGVQLLQDSETDGHADAPVAHLVRLDLSLRGTLAMWGSAAPNLLHHLPDSNELLLGLPLVDRPYVQPVSFSVWRTQESAIAFAHRGTGHRDAVARVRRSQHNLLAHYSTASFEPYRCEGTWKGREPVQVAQTVTGNRQRSTRSGTTLDGAVQTIARLV
jgi:hypothetical protein